MEKPRTSLWSRLVVFYSVNKRDQLNPQVRLNRVHKSCGGHATSRHIGTVDHGPAYIVTGHPRQNVVMSAFGPKPTPTGKLSLVLVLRAGWLVGETAALGDCRSTVGATAVVSTGRPLGLTAVVWHSAKMPVESKRPLPL